MRRFLVAILMAVPMWGQDADVAKAQAEYTKSHYTKFEYKIPMRDGVKLFTTVYVPKDESRKWPVMLQRTPYSVAPYGIDNYRATLGPSDLFTKEGFIFVYQDVRGRYLSEGTFTDVMPHKKKYSGPKDTDEATDAYDAIDWLVKNIPGNNGRVGQSGISYPGHYTAFSMINAHPALKAASPQAPMGDVGNGDDYYHNGAFFLAANFGFYTGFPVRKEPERPKRGGRDFDYGTEDEYDFYLRMGPLANANEKYFKNENPYWNDLLKHADYDEFWQSRSLMQFMKNVTPAALFVGGWFDAEDLAGPLKLYRAVEADGAKAGNTLVMGPWSHGGWARGPGRHLGNLDFNSNTGETFRKDIELPFFVQHLKETKKDTVYPKAWVFETGTNRWRKFETWPPAEAKERKLVLGAGGKLLFEGEAGTGFDEYISDPAHPVPTSGLVGPGMPGDYMTHDQRFGSRRADVLTYVTEPLEHDVTIAGPVTPSLRVSTSGTDSDFVVKLIDVYPGDFPAGEAKTPMGGYQQLVRGEPIRGKYRNSASKPEPFVPGRATKVEFTMPDVMHTFRPGHRIMVQIQSSWFPLVDRNPQKFMNIPDAKASDFVKATERIYQGSELKMRVIE